MQFNTYKFLFELQTAKLCAIYFLFWLFFQLEVGHPFILNNISYKPFIVSAIVYLYKQCYKKRTIHEVSIRSNTRFPLTKTQFCGLNKLQLKANDVEILFQYTNRNREKSQIGINLIEICLSVSKLTGSELLIINHVVAYQDAET